MNQPANEFKDTPMVIVPLEKLSAEAIDGLINEFILREGTDYGKHEYSLDEKHAQVQKQLNAGHCVVVFDMHEGSCSIVRKESLSKFK